MYGKDDTQIMVYNMKKGPRKEDGRKTLEGALGKNYWTLVILLIHKILQWNYSGHAEDNLFIL